jgi:hypothetical protein
MRNPCLDAALAELEAAGVRSYELARGGKHLQLHWSVNGHPLRVLVLPITPSDWRSPHNTRRDVRALLRLDDLLDPPNSNHAPPRARPAHCQWRRQLETLARSLRRVNIPDQHAAERDEIVAALHALIREREP